MKLLLIHSDFIEFEAKKKSFKDAKEPETPKGKVEDCLVAFAGTEKKDEGNQKEIAKNAAKSIRNVMDQVKVDKVVLYPYVHLVQEPSSIHSADNILDYTLNELKNLDAEVTKAPFGYYKSFTIKAKGHPLAELSRVITAEGRKKSKRKQEKEGEATIRTDKELEEYEEHDHRRIGKEMDLFSFHREAPGQPFFHHNGFTLLEELRDFMSSLIKDDYHRVQVPIIWNKELYEKSGHWEHYQENMFIVDVGGNEYGIKPMNCPGHALVYKSDVRSYRDLPFRTAEWTTLYRDELSGVLSGLFRVLALTQDDGHIFCRDDQLESEMEKIFDLLEEVYSTFEFEYSMELSTKPESHVGDDKLWNEAEGVLKNLMDEKGFDYEINEGDGAFYGPKIDIHIKDSLDRSWQCATIQLDYNLANRMDLSYVGEDGDEHRPVVIHRAIYGSFERFLGVLIEHYQGKFPSWLAPVQVAILPISEKNSDYCNEIYQNLKDENLRVKMYDSNNTLEYRIREAQEMKIPYMLVCGDKEEEAGTISVRERDGDVNHGVDPSEFIINLRNKIKNKE